MEDFDEVFAVAFLRVVEEREIGWRAAADGVRVEAVDVDGCLGGGEGDEACGDECEELGSRLV